MKRLHTIPREDLPMSGWQDVISRAAEVVAVIFRSLGIVKTAYEENGIDFYKQMMIGERSPTLFECVLAFCFACRIPPLLQLRKLVLPGSILDTRMKFLLCSGLYLGHRSKLESIERTCFESGLAKVGDRLERFESDLKTGSSPSLEFLLPWHGEFKGLVAAGYAPAVSRYGRLQMEGWPRQRQYQTISVNEESGQASMRRVLPPGLRSISSLRKMANLRRFLQQSPATDQDSPLQAQQSPFNSTFLRRYVQLYAFCMSLLPRSNGMFFSLVNLPFRIHFSDDPATDVALAARNMAWTMDHADREGHIDREILFGELAYALGLRYTGVNIGRAMLRRADCTEEQRQRGIYLMRSGWANVTEEERKEEVKDFLQLAYGIRDPSTMEIERCIKFPDSDPSD